MQRTERLCSVALRCARTFLGRFDDPATRRERDDLVQETAWTAWRWAEHMQEPRRFEAAVRTIARRKRNRMLALQQDPHGAAGELCEPTGPLPAEFLVAGRRVPADWLMDRLHIVLQQLREIDRRILLGHHEGFCCAELALRYRRSEQSVKARIHRARRRVQRGIEDAVHEAGELDAY